MEKRIFVDSIDLIPGKMFLQIFSMRIPSNFFENTLKEVFEKFKKKNMEKFLKGKLTEIAKLFVGMIIGGILKIFVRILGEYI